MNKSKLSLPIHSIVAVAVILALTQWAACRASAAISECIDATCRITTAGGSRGTGCVFEISQGRVYVLTAAHVVGPNQTVQCEFWRHGHRSQPLSGRVIARVENGQCDAAVVALEESQFGGLLPGVIPVAPSDYVVSPGATLVSVGCAKGAWSTGWKGHALGYQGADLHFTPTPADGRSGSAIFDADGGMIVGLLRARTLDGSQGIACSLQSLYGHLQAAFNGTKVQCGPDGCGPGGCPAPRPYLLPYRYREQFRNQPQPQPQQQVWPTLPSPTPGPVPPSATVDLNETNRKIDGLTDKVGELLEEIRADRQSPLEPMLPPLVPPLPATPPGPAVDGTALRTAEEAKAAAAAAKEEVKLAQEETGRLRQAFNALIGDHQTLKQRFDTRIAKVKEELGEGASRREIAGAYVKDLAAEKLGGGAGWTMGKILAGAFGLGGPLALAIAAAGYLVARRIGAKIESGDPLLIQRVLDRLGDKIDDLKDRLRDHQPAKANREGQAAE